MNKQVGNVQLMQKMNRLMVLNFIRNNPSIARPVVAQATGLSLSSITNIVNYLIEKNFVVETGLETVGRVGRKGVLLQFNSSFFQLICVNVEPYHISIVCTDLSGIILRKKKIDIDNQEPKTIADILKKQIKNMISKSDFDKILSIGLALSGLVFDNSRYILSSSMKWKFINLKDELETDIGIPVIIENNSITKAVWQFSIEEQKIYENILFIDMVDGIGAVQFYKDNINRSIIGEIGHTTVEKEGDMCFCGNKGCLEVMCGINRIVEKCKEYFSVDEFNIDDVLLSQQDKAVQKILKECSEYLGIGLANLVNLFNPELIIINGGEYARFDNIIEMAIEHMKQRSYPVLTKNLKIKKVQINFDEEIKGIAKTLCDCIFEINAPYKIIE